MKRLALIATLLLVHSHAVAQESSINRARVMWSAFQCSTYAEMAEDKQSQQRLFKVGYDTGKKFLNDVVNKSVTETEVRDAPIGVRWLLGGPNVDFMIGRIFESASSDAYDSVAKEDSNGLPLIDSSKWATDDALKKSIAENKYLHGNCAVIQ